MDRQPVRIPEALILSATAVLILLIGCGSSAARDTTIGSAAAGRVTITREACGSCHEIPGVENANGLVGPPLAHFAARTMVVGLLPNTPVALEAWLRSPQSVLPGNAMPDMDLTEEQARDVAAYLFSLK